MTEQPSERFVAVPISDNEYVAFPVPKNAQESASDFDWDYILQAAGPLLQTFLHKAGTGGARLFEASPKSAAMYRDAHLNEVGDYFRSVLRDGDGRITHQMQLREVDRLPGSPSAFDPMVAAQLASIQAQLDRVERTLEAIGLSVDTVVRHLETQQRARISAAVLVLRQVHGRVTAGITFSETDWHRVSAIELEIEAQYNAVIDELNQRAVGREFGASPEEDAAEMGRVDPARVRHLLAAQRLLADSIAKWNELLLKRRFDCDEMGPGDLEMVKVRLQKLEDDRGMVLAELSRLAAEASRAKERGLLKRLKTDGAVMGARADLKHLTSVRNGREEIVQAIRPPKSELASTREIFVLSTASPATDNGERSGA